MEQLSRMFERLTITDSNDHTLQTKSYNKTIFGFKILCPYVLFQHQVDAIKWCINRQTSNTNGIKGGILSLQMGMGKTLVMLSLISIHSMNNPNHKYLIMCNKSVLTEIKNEIEKFFGPNFNYSILHPEYVNKFTVDKVDSTTILATYETIRTMANSYWSDNINHVYYNFATIFFKTRFFYVFLDESHRIKNMSTKLYKTVSMLERHFLFCVTGTPCTNNSFGIYPQLLLCGLDKSIKWNKYKCKSLILENCVYFSNFDKVNIPLPTKETIDHYVHLNHIEKSIYERIMLDAKKKFYSEKKSSAGVLLMFMRLRQCCISPRLIKDLSTNSIMNNQHENESTKLKHLLHIIKTKIDGNDKVIVFSAFTSALNLVQDLFRASAVKSLIIHSGMTIRRREQILNQFRNDDSKVLLMTSNIGSLGLNLTTANHVILLEPWWDKQSSEQAVARVWRFGQQKKVYVWRFIVVNTIEQRLAHMCDHKYTNISSDISQEMLHDIFQ